MMLCIRWTRTTSRRLFSASLPAGTPTPADYVRQFAEEGLGHLSRALTKAQVKQLYDLCIDHYNRCTTLVRNQGLDLELQGSGFVEFKMRGHQRYDMLLRQLEDPAQFPFLHSPKAPWLPVVQAILGQDYKHVYTGCMLSLPGSQNQPHHADGPHLTKTYQPAHCLNVFLPLVDITRANGGTQMTPRSHKNYDCPEPQITLLAKSGQAVLFDYRLKHRGLGNSSTAPRPVIYLTYAKPFYSNDANFSRSRYRPLPNFDVGAQKNY